MFEFWVTKHWLPVNDPLKNLTNQINANASSLMMNSLNGTILPNAFDSRNCGSYFLNITYLCLFELFGCFVRDQPLKSDAIKTLRPHKQLFCCKSKPKTELKEWILLQINKHSH